MLQKIKLLVVLFSLSTGSLQAQNIQVIMSPNPSPYISDWQEKTETAILVISNTGTSDIQVKIKTELYDGKGSLVANTDASKMTVIIVPPGVNQFNAEDIFPSNAVSYKGSLQVSTVKTGRIPDDNYKLCVTLIDPQTGAPVGTSGTVCKIFNILAFQAPVLINPRDNESIQETGIKGIMFRWSPVTPSPKTIVTYRLQIWEVLDGQNEMTALRSNQPIVEKDLKGVLQTQWPFDFAMPEVGKKYVWTITPLDDQDRKLVDGSGFAQPFGFEIVTPPPLSQGNPILISPTNNSELTSLKSITFQWKGSPKNTTNPVTYRLKVWQLMEGQNGTHTMRSNKPILEKDFQDILIDMKDQTMKATINLETGPCKPPYLCVFVWTVQAMPSLNVNDVNNTTSEAFEFGFREINPSSVILQFPKSGEEVEPLNEVTFRWTPIVPKPKEPVTYRLTVWHLKQGQNSIQAMRTNTPVVTKDIMDVTDAVVAGIFTCPCCPPYLCDYVWMVQAVDKMGNGIGTNDGKSDAFMFHFKDLESSDITLGVPRGTIETGPFEEGITFRWTPIVPKPQEPVTYRLKVWQLMQGQNGSQAMRTNQPIVTKDVDNLTETTISSIYTGPCKPPYLCDYVWSIQAINRAGSPISNGMSEPLEFTIKNTKSSISLQSPEYNSEIDPLKDLTFRWTPIVPKPKEPVTYRLKVWQLMQGQSGTQAMRTNQPIVTKDVDNLTQVTISNLYTGPCKPPYLCDEMWKVQAIIMNNGVEEIIGESETFGFHVMDGKWSSVKLESPKNLEEVDLEKEITFRWTPIVPKPKEPVTYRLKVWQLMEGQNGSQAMRSNQPVVTKDVENTTEVTVLNLYTGPCKPPYLCDYLWNIQALNKSGVGIGDNNGISEAFEISGFDSKRSSITLQSPKKGEYLDTAKAVTFRWTPIVPKPKEPVTYRLKVWQLMQGQSSTQAMRTNQPIVTKDVDNITEVTISNLYTGPCRPPYLCDYVWGIDAIVGGEYFGSSTSPHPDFLWAPGKLRQSEDEAKEDLKKKKHDLDSLKDELAGIGEKIKDAAKAKRDCDEELKKAQAEDAKAKADLQKQKDINKNKEQNTGEGKYWPDKDAAKKAHGSDYEKDLQKAQENADAAAAKLKDLEIKCPELTKALDALIGKGATLPADIGRGEKAVTDAEKTLQEIIKEKDKCKEGEIRETKTTTSKTYYCATTDTKFDSKVTTNLDKTLEAAKGFSEHIERGLNYIEIVFSKIPGGKGMVKLVKIPADLGGKIAGAISGSGLFARKGLEWVTVEITIGPLHKYTLKLTDLEICKDGKWVPYDKKKCELIDEGLTSLTISHTWKIGGSGDTDLSALTEAGTQFTEKLAEAIQKLIDDAITDPGDIEKDKANCL
ncbi:MAG: hypothetical protein ACKVQB_11295 [Bacteroidia bacterium]